MSADIIILLQLSACFIGLFALAELLYHAAKVQAEYTRKLVHVGTGVLTLLFPVYLEELWQVVVICTAFLALLLLSMKFDLLKSINKVERKTSGSLLYPVIVIIVFAFYSYQSTASFEKYLYFYMPILVMAICDPVAAIVGTQYGKAKGITGKTWAGSVAFMATAITVCMGIFILFNNVNINASILLIHSIVIAITTMLAERWSKNGWDNFTIPLVVVGYLWLIEKMI